MLFTKEDERGEDFDSPSHKQFERAKNSAAGHLARRPHSRQELEHKLHEKGHDAKAVQQALERLAELGLQSDADFAEVFARSKWRQSRWAPSRIRMELVKRGVAKQHIEAGLESVFGEHSERLNVDFQEAEAPDLSALHGRLDLDLLESTRRQTEVTRGMPLQTRRRRMVAWLERRGHSWDTISQVLRKLELF
eukprot:jgi/Astpho2/9741/Aster-03719